MKTLLVGLVLVSTSSFAHETSYSSDSCNVDINGGVSISKSDIEFLKHDKSLYKIVNNSTLVIKGEEVPLTSNQQILVTQFSTDIRALIPQAKNVATDALSLASEGVSLVFNELLGENNAVVEDLSTHFNEINYEIEKSFSADQTIYFDEDGFSRNEFFGDDFEERIESAVEQTIQNSIGSLMVAVGQELLFSGGNMDAFEAKMENFEEQMEYEMELRGQDIEKRANALCDALIAIDRIEENMRNEISEVAKFDILTASAKNQNRT